MKLAPVHRVLLYYLPLVVNVVLAIYLGWQLMGVEPAERDSRVFMFSFVYGLGGIVLAVSGVTAFFHATAQIGAHRGYYALSLLNIIVPTVLVLLLLYKT
jgi:heme/copper-type cytochrome/quinol oxidase subunit 2